MVATCGYLNSLKFNKVRIHSISHISCSSVLSGHCGYWLFVSLPSGNTILQAGWLKSIRNFFLTVLRARKSMMKLKADSVPDDALFPGWPSLHCILTWQKR